MLRVLGKSTVQRARTTPIVRLYSPQAPNANVPGLSEKCVKVPNNAVGPGASKNSEYKNPEYYCYTVDSFAEAEVEMARFRLPAPSNKKANK